MGTTWFVALINDQYMFDPSIALENELDHDLIWYPLNKQQWEQRLSACAPDGPPVTKLTAASPTTTDGQDLQDVQCPASGAAAGPGHRDMDQDGDR